MPKLRLDGDASGAIKAVTDLHNAQADLVKEGGNLEKQSKKLGSELSSAAKRAQTDWQKYNAEVGRLAELVKRNVITQKQAEATAQKYYQTIFKGAIAAKQAAKDELAARHAATQAAKQEAAQRKVLIAAALRFHNIAKAERGAIEEKKRALERIRSEIILVDHHTKALERTQEKSFGRQAVERLGAYALGYVGIQKAIQLASSEIESYKRIEESRTQAHLTVADAQSAFRENVAFTVSESDQKRMEDAVLKISTDRGLPQQGLYGAMTSAFGATGSADLSIEIIDEMTKITRNMERIGEAAGGVGDVLTTAGLKTVKEAIGFVGITAGEARVVEIDKTARETGRVAAAFSSSLAGSSPAEGASLFAALTKGGADPYGETTRTGTIQLISKTQKWFEKNAGDLGLKPEQFDEFTERRKLLFGDRSMAEGFLRDTKFSATVRGAIEKVFLGEGGTREAFEKTYKQLNTPGSLEAAADEAQRRVGLGPLQTTAQVEGAIQSVWQRFATKTDVNLSQERQKEIIDLMTQFTGLPRSLNRASAFTHAGFSMNASEAVSFIETNLGDPHATTATTGDKAEAREGLREMVAVLKQIEANQRKKPVTVGREKVK